MLVDYVRVYQATTVTPATPVVAPGQVVNAASLLGDLAPGGLATLYGTNLVDGTPSIDATSGFPTSAGNVTVSVNGVKAPLVYVSPMQINFQIPWEVAPGTSIPVVVTRDVLPSSPENVTIAAPQAPSMFLSEYVSGVAWLTGTGCETTECAVQGEHRTGDQPSASANDAAEGKGSARNRALGHRRIHAAGGGGGRRLL